MQQFTEMLVASLAGANTLRVEGAGSVPPVSYWKCTSTVAGWKCIIYLHGGDNVA